MAQWLGRPAGRYIVGWEQRLIDRAVADLFGFHALQLGLAQIDGLRANRMPHRWVASDTLLATDPIDLPPVDDALPTLAPHDALGLHCDLDALPFPNQSLDLVVMPHALELAEDPRQTLREVERVLVAEGRVVISGFNPISLWSLHKGAARLARRVGWRGGPSVPSNGELIGYWRLRDWLRLLGFEIEHGRFACWRPPLARQRWLDRVAWMDRFGERWCPVLGSVYFIVAVKRVRGMRLVGMIRKRKSQAAPAPAVAARVGGSETSA